MKRINGKFQENGEGEERDLQGKMKITILLSPYTHFYYIYYFIISFLYSRFLPFG